MALDGVVMYRKKPVTVAVAEVLGEPYTCRNPGKEDVVAHPGEHVVNPGSDDEYPITAERLAELYEKAEGGGGVMNTTNPAPGGTGPTLIRKLYDALTWTGGAADFQPGDPSSGVAPGGARKGWEEIVQPVLEEARRAMAGGA